ncbi:MAG: RluA family pseudouridine synthase [Acidimicrobiales bacterium]
MAEAWRVPAALDGERLDRAVATLTGLSRREVDGLVGSGKVLIGGEAVGSRSRKVRAGEMLSVDVPVASQPPGDPPADPGVEVAVVYCDDEVIVVDKPAGLVVHPGAGNSTGTLVQGLLARFPDLAGLGGGAGQADRPGIVHRLDKGTSGLLVVARTPAARASLVDQLSRRSVEREYVALVAGALDGGEGLIDAPLGRSDRDPTRVAVQAGGREARTRYQVDARYSRPAPVTLLRCRLETGRTHQIRVHLSSIGHPVVGDARYGARMLPGVPGPGRPFLHASVLGFDSPAGGRRLLFHSELPADLREVLAAFS